MCALEVEDRPYYPQHVYSGRTNALRTQRAKMEHDRPRTVNICKQKGDIFRKIKDLGAEASGAASHWSSQDRDCLPRVLAGRGTVRAAACKVSTHLNRAQSRCLRSGNSESHLKRTETGLCRVETLVAAQALTCRHMPVQA